MEIIKAIIVITLFITGFSCFCYMHVAEEGHTREVGISGLISIITFLILNFIK